MVKEAVILAGGAGTRLRSVVPDLPKPLAPVGNKPFLHYQLSFLKAQGVERVVFSLCYKPELIQAAFGATYLGLELDYAVEPDFLGTGGAIRWSSERVKGERWFVLNGDTYFPVSLSKMVEQHERLHSEMTMALKPVDAAGRFGGVVVKNQRIVGFEEKGNAGAGVINAGIYLMTRPFVELFPSTTPLSFERDVMPKVLTEHPIHGYSEDAYFIDLGVPEDYQRAQRELPVYSE